MLLTVAAGQAQVVVDGEFDDWRMQASLAESFGDSAGALDLGPVQWRLDTAGLWVSLALDQPRNLQAMDHTLALLLDTAPDSGLAYRGHSGVDRVIEYSAPREQGLAGVTVLTASGSEWRRGAASDLDLRSSPTFADTRFELRIRAFDGLDGASLRVLLYKDDKTIDQTDAVVLGAASQPVQHVRPVLWRPGDADLRVMSWNVGGEAVRRDPQPLARLVAAVKPDVVLLDEVPTGVDFTRVFDDTWTVVYGTSGGSRQRGVIASRLPLSPAPAFEVVKYPDGATQLVRANGTPFMRRDLRRAGADGISAAGALLRFQGTPVLLVALDLQCCGRLGSVQDRMRHYQAEGIRRAMATTRREFSVSHVLLGGDVNLVGSRRPLEILADQSGPGGSDLQPVAALQPDGLANVTWYRDGDIFPPGRLDFLLHSAGLQALNGWVLDTGLMDAPTRANLGLSLGLESVSDHRPIVADFKLEH